jgi:hypothetical protein
MFWSAQAVLLDVGNKVPELVDEEAAYSNEASDADCQEAEAYFADIKPIDGRVYQWEDLKEAEFKIREIFLGIKGTAGAKQCAKSCRNS